MKWLVGVGVVSVVLGGVAGTVAGRAASPDPSSSSSSSSEPVRDVIRVPGTPIEQGTVLNVPATRDCLPVEPQERRRVLEDRHRALSQELAVTRGFRDREYGTPVVQPSAHFGEPVVSEFFSGLQSFGEGTLECARYPCTGTIDLADPADFEQLTVKIQATYPDAVLQRGNTDAGDVSARVQFAGATATSGEVRRLRFLMASE